ncbi:MAG: molybdenum cofactor guanylyltransferase [Micavibrio sp.]
MPDLSRIAGIVLAGGQSSRMGRNKALLDYKGRPLVRHMAGILYALGLKDVFISGTLEDYPSIKDDVPLAGPVQGISSVLRNKPGYSGYIFVPVDMPLLQERALQLLLREERGGYFTGWPLPAYITPPFTPSQSPSVRGFLEAQGARSLALPPELEPTMKNINTPQEWAEVISQP